MIKLITNCLLVLFLIIAFFKSPFAYANPTKCSDIFNDLQGISNKDFQDKLQDSLIKDEIVIFYSQKNTMPQELKLVRVEEWLYTDTRYQLLKALERDALVHRITRLIEEESRLPMEDILEKYYSNEGPKVLQRFEESYRE